MERTGWTWLYTPRGQPLAEATRFSKKEAATPTHSCTWFGAAAILGRGGACPPSLQGNGVTFCGIGGPISGGWKEATQMVAASRAQSPSKLSGWEQPEAVQMSILK